MATNANNPPPSSPSTPTSPATQIFIDGHNRTMSSASPPSTPTQNKLTKEISRLLLHNPPTPAEEWTLTLSRRSSLLSLTQSVERSGEATQLYAEESLRSAEEIIRSVQSRLMTQAGVYAGAAEKARYHAARSERYGDVSGEMEEVAEDMDRKGRHYEKQAAAYLELAHELWVDAEGHVEERREHEREDRTLRGL